MVLSCNLIPNWCEVFTIAVTRQGTIYRPRRHWVGEFIQRCFLGVLIMMHDAAVFNVKRAEVPANVSCIFFYGYQVPFSL